MVISQDTEASIDRNTDPVGKYRKHTHSLYYTSYISKGSYPENDLKFPLPAMEKVRIFVCFPIVPVPY